MVGGADSRLDMNVNGAKDPIKPIESESFPAYPNQCVRKEMLDGVGERRYE